MVHSDALANVLGRPPTKRLYNLISTLFRFPLVRKRLVTLEYEAGDEVTTEFWDKAAAIFAMWIRIKSRNRSALKRYGLYITGSTAQKLVTRFGTGRALYLEKQRGEGTELAQGCPVPDPPTSAGDVIAKDTELERITEDTELLSIVKDTKLQGHDAPAGHPSRRASDTDVELQDKYIPTKYLQRLAKDADAWLKFLETRDLEDLEPMTNMFSSLSV